MKKIIHLEQEDLIILEEVLAMNEAIKRITIILIILSNNEVHSTRDECFSLEESFIAGRTGGFSGQRNNENNGEQGTGRFNNHRMNNFGEQSGIFCIIELLL